MTRYRRTRKPKKAGRPPLPSTLWLAEQLRSGGDPWQHFGAWNLVHLQTMGYPCKDARRSFRAALRVAERMAT